MGYPKRPPAKPPTMRRAVRGALTDPDARKETVFLAGVDPGPEEFKVRPEQAISRWYENADGGFAETLRASVEALQQDPPAGRYGRWSQASLSEPNIVQGVDRSLDGDIIKKGVFGRHFIDGPDPDSPHVIQFNTELAPEIEQRAVLDHEVTHSLMMAPRRGMGSADQNMFTAEADGPFFRDPQTLVADSWLPEDYAVARRASEAAEPRIGQIQAALRSPALDPKLRDELKQKLDRVLQAAKEDAEYLLSRKEIDPRLADIRRRYAWDTGKQVRNAADAETAWNWWRDNMQRWLTASSEQPTINALSFRVMDNLPQEAKQRMYRRMVQVPAVLATLIGAGQATAQPNKPQEQ